jgi:hypothetical protein
VKGPTRSRRDIACDSKVGGEKDLGIMLVGGDGKVDFKLPLTLSRSLRSRAMKS